ncbi:MAG: DNA (cytosine-5-)-methyltransferase [Clostridia bacterium]|nr:DNA (cytosine-5-)-methyltransferase [Clostridia bacterium]
MQISMFDGTERLKITKPIRLIELFAGIGAQSKALKNLGVDFEHYRICEFDKYAVQSYNAIHGTDFETSDITKINANDLGIVDADKYCYIMTYSFPCQDLSNAGLGKGMAKGSGTRSGLLWEVERLLDECKELPQVLVMENVPAVIGAKSIQHFAKWQEKLEQLGYKNKWQVLNAKDYGIPQNRERCFMVSILGDNYYEFPQTITLKLRLKDMLEKEVDEKYYLSDKMIRYIMANNEKWTGNNNKSLINKTIASTLTTGEGTRRCDVSNYISSELPDNFDLKELRFIEPLVLDGFNQQIRADSSVVGTLTRQCGADLKRNGQGIIESPYRIRKLTPTECWRLMGFEDAEIDNAIASGMSNSQLYKQAGNSIVVDVLMAIFKQML